MKRSSELQTKSDEESKSESRSEMLESLSGQLEEFFFYLTKTRILAVFQKFRECENKKNSRIPFREFCKKTNNRQNHGKCLRSEAQKLVRGLLRPVPTIREIRGERDQVINMYDFLTSLTIFLKLDNLQKAAILMQLMDVDEDFCLSILEIKKMLRRR